MRVMRTRGHGTIEMHRGKPRVRLTLPDGTRPAYPIPGDVDPEAYREALVERLGGTANDPLLAGRTLGAWGATWLDSREKTHRDGDGDRQRWGAYIAGTPLASVRLDAISATHVLAWARKLVAKRTHRGPISRRTALTAWTTLRACLRDAVEHERMNADRLGAILVLRLPASPIAADVEIDERIEWLRAVEIDRVLALSLTDEQRSAFLVGTFSAMRAGELHGLDFARVDWEDRCVVVARSRKGATKGGKTGRVPLLPPAYDALRARWEKMGKPSRGLVWPADGGGCHSRGYDWGWSDHPSSKFVKLGLRRLAGIRRHVTWKDATRHTCAVHLLRGTWAPAYVPRPYRMEEVSRWLRHSSVAVTEKHYAALTLDALPVSAPAERPQPPTRSSTVRLASRNLPSLPSDCESRPLDLNQRPTVYESGADPSRSEALRLVGVVRDVALDTLAGIARVGPMESGVEALTASLAIYDELEHALLARQSPTSATSKRAGER
jgi:integrase